MIIKCLFVFKANKWNKREREGERLLKEAEKRKKIFY